MKEIFNELFLNTAIASNGAASSTTGAEGPGIESLFIQLVIIFVIFYFILIRPQQKKQKAQKEMNNALKKGDSVITISGVYGVVAKANDKDPYIELEIAKGTIIKVLRSSVGEKLEGKVKLVSGENDEADKKKTAKPKKKTATKKKATKKTDEAKGEDKEEKKTDDKKQEEK